MHYVDVFFLRYFALDFFFIPSDYGHGWIVRRLANVIDLAYRGRVTYVLGSINEKDIGMTYERTYANASSQVRGQ